MPTLKTSQINNLLLYLEELEKEEITKSKASRRKETTKIRIDIVKQGVEQQYRE